MEETTKENAREDSQDIRLVHGWHRRGGACMDITLD